MNTVVKQIARQNWRAVVSGQARIGVFNARWMSTAHAGQIPLFHFERQSFSSDGKRQSLASILKEKLDVANTLKDQTARVTAHSEQQERIVAQINAIQNPADLVDLLNEYFESAKIVNDRENQIFLEAFVSKVESLEWADRGTALALVNVILKNLSEFERSQSARNQYQVKLSLPAELVSLLSFEDCSSLLNTLMNDIPFNKQLKYNNYGTVFSKILCEWMAKAEDVGLDQLMAAIEQAIPELNSKMKHKQRKEVELAF